MKKQNLFIVSTIFFFGLIFSMCQYYNTFKTEGVSAVTIGTHNPGHAWSEMECSSDTLCIDATNKRLGIGTNTPSTQLDVAGSIHATNSICVGSGSSQVCLTPSTYASTCAAATGNGITCVETTDGSYVINSFVLSGTGTSTTLWTVPAGVTSIEYLVVGGGGAGGGYSGNSQNGGGGGAGGMLTGTKTVNSGSSYTITVGSGGVVPRGNGGNSSIVGVAAVNGGGGGGDATGTAGYTGGSSGGSSGAYAPVAPTPSDLSQGHIGGRGDNPACYTGGGGGGKSADGGTASHTVGGSGGAGAYSSITGTSLAYAGGGGGGGGYSSTAPGAGGVGGGGSGASTQTGTATSGTMNTGGGGGGTFGGTAGAGGSGIVIVRYLHP